MHSVYHLIDPNTKNIRYVGQIKNKIEERLNQHIKKTKYKSNKLYNVNYWIGQLLQQNQLPLISLVSENLSQEQADILEKEEISKLKLLGYDLCNLTSGGDGSFEMSSETKQKMSESHKGEKNHFYGKHHTEETKNFLRETNKHSFEKFFAKLSPEEEMEWRKNFSEANSGENNGFYGKSHSEETKEKISINNSKEWSFISPFGEILNIKNLNKFCREKNLLYEPMRKLCHGYITEYKGWKYNSKK